MQRFLNNLRLYIKACTDYIHNSKNHEPEVFAQSVRKLTFEAKSISSNLSFPHLYK